MATFSVSADDRFDAISFDLFGTLVFVDVARLPREVVDGEERILTIPGLSELLSSLDTRATVAEFWGTAAKVAAQLAEEKAINHLEVPSQQRFVRVLRELGLDGSVEGVAREMSERHMRSLGDAVVCPPGRVELLRELGARFRLALISNFDHAATARSILDRSMLTAAFRWIVISEEAGICKPAARIFVDTCRRLDVVLARCLHVGDSRRADIDGACSAGLNALWVAGPHDRDGDPAPALGTIADVNELPAWLGAR